jgi:mannosyltransferase OCH1-like enzyme
MYKICILTSLDYHHEVYGTFFEFVAAQNAFVLDLYITPEILSNKKSNWISFYERKYYNVPHRWLDVANFTEVDAILYDIVIITTESDDTLVKKFKNSQFKEKIVVYRHLFMENNFIENVWQTRKVDSFNNPVVFPVMNVISTIYDKKFYHNTTDQETVVIGIIGGGSVSDEQMDYSIIQRIKNGTKRLHFIVINRIAQKSLVNKLGKQNVTEIVSASAYDMFKHVSACDFILHNKVENTPYEHDIMSGSLPLAFSVLTQIIMSSENNDRYFNFKNIIGYDRNSLSPIVLSKSDEKVWKAILYERDEMHSSNFQSISQTIENIQKRKSDKINLTNIPKILNFVWLNDGRMYNKYFPKKYEKNLNEWRKMYHDHEVIVYGMDEVLELIDLDKSMEKYKTMLLNIKPHICKCDVARLIVLACAGGYYIDCDFIANKEIISVIDKSSDTTGLCLFEEILEHQMNKKKKQISNGFIISPKKHPFIKGLLDKMLEDFEMNPEIYKTKTVMDRTGPTFIGEYWKDNWENKIELLNGAIVMPLKNNGEISENHENNKSIAAVTIWNDGTNWGLNNMDEIKLERSFSQIVNGAFSDEKKKKKAMNISIAIGVVAAVLFIIVIALTILLLKKRN